MPYTSPLKNIPWVESPFFMKELRHIKLEPEQEMLAKKFYNDGYLVIDLASATFDSDAQNIIDNLDGYTPPHNKLPGAWTTNEGVKNLACNQKIIDTLHFLYRRKPFPFQTLNFNRGSEQSVHSDAVHFHSIPERFMCGAWIALEDIDEENGPLAYYPGSHKLPVYQPHELGIIGSSAERNYQNYPHMEQLFIELIEAHNFKKELGLIKKGQAIIWAANLLHAGFPIVDNERTRYSQVTHYFFHDCVYYTPMLSDPFLNKIAFRSPIDIQTGKPVNAYYVSQLFNSEP